MSWRPRSQSSTKNGPLPIGAPVLGSSMVLVHTFARSTPRSACEGRMLPKYPRQAAKRGRRTRWTVFGLTARMPPSTAVVTSRPERVVFPQGLQREQEVTCGDGHTVAPPRVRMDAVCERERSLLPHPDAGHESRPPGVVGSRRRTEPEAQLAGWPAARPGHLERHNPLQARPRSGTRAPATRSRQRLCRRAWASAEPRRPPLRRRGARRRSPPRLLTGESRDHKGILRLSCS